MVCIVGVINADWVTSPTVKGRSGSMEGVSGWDIIRKGKLTVCSHDCGEHRFNFVHCHYAMGEERLEKHAMDMSVALTVRHIANQRCFVPRHVSRGRLRGAVWTWCAGECGVAARKTREIGRSDTKTRDLACVQLYAKYLPIDLTTLTARVCNSNVIIGSFELITSDNMASIYLECLHQTDFQRLLHFGVGHDSQIYRAEKQELSIDLSHHKALNVTIASTTAGMKNRYMTSY